MFQSLLCWMWVSDTSARKTTSGTLSFQSLLCWMWVSDHLTHELFRTDDEFQSLLCWMWVSDYSNGSRPRILRGFNPCCAGCGFQTPTRQDSRVWQGNVSILVVLDVGFRRDTSNTITLALAKFQSLLCWMWVSDSPCVGRACLYRCVSILVVLDVGFRLGLLQARDLETCRFNPCCAGCGFQTSTPDRPARWRYRFNPCCAGCGFQTTRGTSGIIWEQKFQSLLCWMWVSDRTS